MALDGGKDKKENVGPPHPDAIRKERKTFLESSSVFLLGSEHVGPANCTRVPEADGLSNFGARQNENSGSPVGKLLGI